MVFYQAKQGKSIINAFIKRIFYKRNTLKKCRTYRSITQVFNMTLYWCSSPPWGEYFGRAVVIKLWLSEVTGGSSVGCERKFLWSSPGGGEFWLSPRHFSDYINLSTVTKTWSETVISCKRLSLTFLWPGLYKIDCIL